MKKSPEKKQKSPEKPKKSPEKKQIASRSNTVTDIIDELHDSIELSREKSKQDDKYIKEIQDY